MLISQLQAEGVEECLRRNIPFVLYALPGMVECRFMASLPDSDGQSPVSCDSSGSDCFMISRYASDEPYVSGVTSGMDEGELIDLVASKPDLCYPSTSELPSLSSTHRISYGEAFRAMTGRLKKYGGKVVLSRHEAIFSSRDIVDVAGEYFSCSPGTFRYLSFTPETGVWLGATPEVLIETTAGGDEIRTMALAGTKPSGDCSGEWDEKNTLEHRVVVDFISDILASHGLEVNCADTIDLRAGAVTHLCTPITARGEIHSPMTIVNDLNPTPAVAGWPRDMAMAEIDALETHLRRCYSGIVGVRHNGELRIYVNLRCAFAARGSLYGTPGWIYNLYAGGGLMSDSDVEQEWDETDRKLSVLRSCLDIAPPGSTETLVMANPFEAQFS